MAWGTNALVTKPANSLAPMLTVAVFNAYGYHSGHSSPREAKTLTAHSDSVVLHNAMRTYAGLVPLVIGILQLVIWTKYNIRDSHLYKQKQDERCQRALTVEHPSQDNMFV